MKLQKFNKIILDTPDDVKAQIKLSMDILDRINELLDKKFEGKQNLLAKKMGKSEAEVSKWLSGVQNFTVKTLVKLQIAFEEPIIVISKTNNNNPTIKQLQFPTKKINTKLLVDSLQNASDIDK